MRSRSNEPWGRVASTEPDARAQSIERGLPNTWRGGVRTRLTKDVAEAGPSNQRGHRFFPNIEIRVARQ